MKYLLITFALLSLASCQNNPNVPNSSPSPTVSPTATVTPEPSPTSLTLKYTREDYIRIFDCTLAIKDKTLKPEYRGRVAAHASLIKNDFVWNTHKDTEQIKVYDESVATISLPLGCK